VEKIDADFLGNEHYERAQILLELDQYWWIVNQLFLNSLSVKQENA
jgi:hypothetical protein